MDKEEVRKFISEVAKRHNHPFRSELTKWRDDINAKLKKQIDKVEKQKKIAEECNKIWEELFDEDWQKLPKALEEFNKKEK